MPVPEVERPTDWESEHHGITLQGPTPPITIEMSLDRPVWQLSTGKDGLPNLIFTLTSHLNHPITLQTFNTVLDANRPYQHHFYNQLLSVTDFDTGQQIYVPETGQQRTCLKRAGPPRIRRRESDFITLHPNEPSTVSYPVPYLSYNERYNSGNSKLIFAPRGHPVGAGPIYRRFFEPEHRYCFEIQKRAKQPVMRWPPNREDFQLDLWWRYGTTEQVMAPPGPTPEGKYMGWTENRIRIGGVQGVELAIEE